MYNTIESTATLAASGLNQCRQKATSITGAPRFNDIQKPSDGRYETPPFFDMMSDHRILMMIYYVINIQTPINVTLPCNQ